MASFDIRGSGCPAQGSTENRKSFVSRCVGSALAVGAMLITVPLMPAIAADTGEERRDQAGEIVRESVTPEQDLLGKMQDIGTVRVVVHALEPADHLAGQLSSLLQALGVSQVERRLVDAVPDRNQVRYYHSADRQAGQAVGDALGLVFDDVAVRDFADYQPVPSEGLIEIWLR
ncbi:hypothetical protein ACUNV4_01105 [Granulosicoccus sp. 3-233]|uniref:hypothetical protein n=1 Tax=Granulosicoccus sp. 3-233 TaxID=3417969 RepID=UPI003D34551C